MMMSATIISKTAQIVFVSLMLMSSLFSISAYIFLRYRLTRQRKPKRKNIEEKIIARMQEEINQNLLSPQEVQSDGVLPASSTILGIVKLEAYAKQESPKHIVGVNRGGWLLSTYLAHRLEIKRSRVLRYSSEDDKFIESAEKAKINLGDRVLLIGDISRSGRSIDKAAAYIRSNFPDSQLRVAALVVCKDEPKQTVDFSAYYTKEEDVQLPWSSRKPSDPNQLSSDRQKKTWLVGQSKLSLEEDPDILRLAYEDEDSSQSGIDIVMSDMEQFLHINNLERRLQPENIKPRPNNKSTTQGLV
ncbi:MAG: phosphoribosyltransferase [Cyanobacteria bacterium J06623_4]